MEILGVAIGFFCDFDGATFITLRSESRKWVIAIIEIEVAPTAIIRIMASSELLNSLIKALLEDVKYSAVNATKKMAVGKKYFFKNMIIVQI